MNHFLRVPHFYAQPSTLSQPSGARGLGHFLTLRAVLLHEVRETHEQRERAPAELQREHLGAEGRVRTEDGLRGVFGTLCVTFRTRLEL